MSKNTRNSGHNTKWNARFEPRQATAEIAYLGDNTAIINCQNVTSAALRRIGDVIEEEMLCEKCSVQDETTITLIRPDFGMMLAVDFVCFLISAFENENYDLTIDQSNLNT